MHGEFENKKKKDKKIFDLPDWGFEPRIFSNFPALDLNFRAMRKKSPLPSRKNMTLSTSLKGQLILKANCQAMNSSKKRTNQLVFTTERVVFVRFLEEIEDAKTLSKLTDTFSTNH